MLIWHWSSTILDIAFRTSPVLSNSKRLPEQAGGTTQWGSASHGNLRLQLWRLKEVRQQMLPINRSGSPNSLLTPSCRWNSLHCRLSSVTSLYTTQCNSTTVSLQLLLECCLVAACPEAIIPEQTQNYTTTALLRGSAAIIYMYHTLILCSSSQIQDLPELKAQIQSNT